TRVRIILWNLTFAVKTVSFPSIFFFQAEDGIRDGHVTGVQTCALPIFYRSTTSVVALCASTLTISRPSRFARTSCAARGHVPSTQRRRTASTVTRWKATTCGSCRGSEIGRASCRERGEKRGERRGVQ